MRKLGIATITALTVLACWIIGPAAATGAEDAPKGKAAAPSWPVHLLYLDHIDSKNKADAERVALLKQKGFAGCGFCTYVPEPVTLEGRRKSLEDAGLRLVEVFTIVNVTKPLDENYFKTLIPKLGAHKSDCVLNLTGAAHGSRAYDDKIVQMLTAVSDIARKHGVRVTIYPHSGHVVETIGHVVDLVKRVNRPGEVGAMFLEYHWRYCDPNHDLKAILENAQPWLLKVAVELPRLNSEDVTTFSDTPEEIQKGKASLRAMFRILRDLGYQGDVGFEPHSSPGQDLDKLLDKSMASWKKLMASL